METDDAPVQSHEGLEQQLSRGMSSLRVSQYFNGHQSMLEEHNVPQREDSVQFLGLFYPQQSSTPRDVEENGN